MTAVRPDDTAGTGEHAERIAQVVLGVSWEQALAELESGELSGMAEESALRSVIALVSAVREAEARRDRAERALREIAKERFGHMPDGSTPAAFALAAVSGEAPNDE